jgi:PAS domain S-box-containing protein
MDPVRALDAIDDVFYVADEEGRLVDWNGRLPELTGHDDEALASMRFGDLFVPADRESGTAAVEAALDGDRSRETLRVVTEDGASPHEFVSSGVDHEDGPRVCGVGRDVNDRRAVESELAESEASLARLYRITSQLDLGFEEKLTRILELGSDRLDLPYGFLTDIDDGTQRIVLGVGDHPELQTGASCPLSESYCRKTIDSEGLLGVLDAAAEGWEEDPAYERFGLGSYLGGKVVVDGEVFGTLCFASDTPHDPFTDSERTFVELLTRWAGYELEQREAKRRLERQNERLSEFASVLSHDIRTPLNVVRGRMDLARESGDTSHLDDAEAALDRMESLVTDLLVLARDGEVVDELTPVSLESLARETWETTPTPDTELVVAADATLVADPSRLRQLLGNLFKNSVEHGATEGTDGLTVRVGTLEGAGFYVEDTGVGIPPERREAVLERGVSDDGGTGIGLDIVHTIADAHGWTMSIAESQEGGARFEFRGVDSDADTGALAEEPSVAE